VAEDGKSVTVTYETGGGNELARVEVTEFPDRTRYGMRADAAYVQTLLGRRSPYTAAEARWVALLNEIDAGDEETLDFKLWQQFPKTYAGSVFVTRYPNPPLVVYRFTKSAQAHLRAIRKRSEHPANARVATAMVTRSTLERLSERISEAVSRQRAFDGIYVASAGQDRATQSVLVQVVTTRSDAQAYLAAKFGPHVRTEVVGDRVECYLERNTSM